MVEAFFAIFVFRMDQTSLLCERFRGIGAVKEDR
jgi:hypothetical protein